MSEKVTVEKKDGMLWCGRFEAMKSPCEIWLESQSQQEAERLIEWAASEALRIEAKYSRFRADSVLSYINQEAGSWVVMDEETEALVDFAACCWEITDGMIDVTVGVYLENWRFDGKTLPPSRNQMKALKSFVGWDKVQLKAGKIFLPEGMRLDFGGIGKEYAVDMVATQLASKVREGGVMVNFGGDLNAIRPRNDGKPWRVTVERAVKSSFEQKTLQLYKGAVATSGDTKRFAIDKKRRVLGHILNPKTGWPVPNSPASITVVSETAMQSGLLSTLAMMKGADAEVFLSNQDVQFYCQWR